MIIAVDAGKYRTKSVSEYGTLSFRTKIEPFSRWIDSKNTYSIEFQGEKYLLGEGARYSDFDVTKQKLVHKLAIYTAITQHLKHNSPIRLLVGCPISVFNNQSQRDNFKNYLIGDGNILLKVDQNYFDFIIKDVIILPESVGLLYQRPALYRSSLIGIVDIGGLNTNGAIYDGLKPIRESMFTINQGGEVLNAKIRKALNEHYSLNIQDYEMPHIIRSGISLNGTIVENTLIDEVMVAHIEGILEEMKRNNWNVSGLDLIFTGGGSQLLENYIRQIIPHAKLSGDPVWDNVLGFYKVGEMLD